MGVRVGRGTVFVWTMSVIIIVPSLIISICCI